MSYPASPGGWPDPAARPVAGQPQDPYAPVGGEVVPPPSPPPPAYPPGAYAMPSGPPGYGPVGPPGPVGYPQYGYLPPPKTNGMAIAAMVVSISVAVLMCISYGFAGLAGVVGAILGHVARRQIRERGESGDGMALAGVIIGWIAFGLAVAVIAIFVIFVWAIFATAAAAATGM